MSRWKGIPEGNQFSLSRRTRMNIEDAKKKDRQADRHMHAYNKHARKCV
jgi:hypothetical protein